MKTKTWLVMMVVLVMGMAVCTGCTDNGGEGANSEVVNSEVVSENADDLASSEEDSEVVSDEPESENTEESEEAVSEEEPVIVNVILTREEADAYIEDLKVKYPEMSEEDIVTLFVNFNIHSLDEETLIYYTTNYDCNSEFHNIVSRKLDGIFNTLADSDEGKKYLETWNLTDFITNEQLKIFTEEIELYLSEITTIEQFEKCSRELNDYMYGTNTIGFTYDYNSPQREDTDLDGICFFIARYNFQYNNDKLGFSDLASQEVLYTLVEKWQMEQGIEE